MHSFIRTILALLLTPIATSLFVVAIAGLYSHVEWPGTFFMVLAICYPTAIVLGIPAFWILRAWKRQQLWHFFLAGLIIGVLPSTLLYAISVEPVLTLAALAGAALGGMVFWAIAVGQPNEALEP